MDLHKYRNKSRLFPRTALTNTSFWWRGCAIGSKGKQVCKHYLNTFRALNINVVGIKYLGL